MVIVIAVEGGSRLFTVDQIIGAVKIQNQLGRWRRKGFDENLHQYPTDVPATLRGRPVLKAAQSRAAGQSLILSDGGLDRRVGAKRAVVIEVLVAQGQAVDSLA